MLVQRDFCIEDEERESQGKVIDASRSDGFELIILVASATTMHSYSHFYFIFL